jgi:RimJ/RimL family protein N-acetyltransferase
MDSEIIGEDFLDFKCPHCGALNSFSTSAAGLARECMNCMELLLVPARDNEAACKLPLPVETPKLRLRPFEPGDWKDLLEFQFEEEDDATGWIHRISQLRSTETHQPFYLAIEARDPRKVIGSLSFMFTDPAYNQLELALFSKGSTLQGMELEAWDAALDFCFQDLNLHRVYAQCETKDTESRKLFTEAGMRQEAEFVKNYCVNGEWLSTCWFAILEDEFFTDPSAEEKKAL